MRTDNLQGIRDFRAASQRMMMLRAAGTPPNISYGEGFIVHDDYDKVLFDDLNRDYPMWNLIPKVPTLSDFTTGFLQSGVGAARMVDKNSIAFSATTQTRSAHTPIEIKAITTDRTFGMYKRSLYAQMGSRYGDLTQKDILDMKKAMLDVWNDKLYNGTVVGDALDFEGLKILVGSGTAVAATTSVIRAIQEAVLAMVNSSTKRVRPTAIFTNAIVSFYVKLEQLKMGDKFVVIKPNNPGNTGEPATYIDTVVGPLPLYVDAFNSVVSGTPNTYPTFILSMDKLRWEYVEPLGNPSPEPTLFEFPMETTLDQKHKGIMFGALDGDGFSSNVHHVRLNIGARTTVVDPTA